MIDKSRLEQKCSTWNIALTGTQLDQLDAFAEILVEYNQKVNLTAITDPDQVVDLHMLDSAALLTVEDFSGKKVIDVGTGAGFPGLALKIACPDMELTLLDSLDKRIGFLRDTCALLGFDDVRCIHARAEEAPAELHAGFDIACSRAVARLNLLCELCLPLAKKGGAFIAMKGPDCADELNAAKRAIKLLGGEVEDVKKYLVPGTDATHSAIIIRKTADTPAKYPRRWAQIKKQPL